ncbi:MAG: TrmH family RNA methyltransferase [Patescibacteria group bacterium]
MLYVALNNIRSLYNVGSIFRTADAFDVDKIILGGYTGAPPRKEITKVALGAEQYIKWEKNFNLHKKLFELKKQGFEIIGLENNNFKIKTIALNKFKPKFPMVLVLGNEVNGITPSVLKEIDRFIEIPMKGIKESLNVSVALGIALYAIKNF